MESLASEKRSKKAKLEEFEDPFGSIAVPSSARIDVLNDEEQFKPGPSAIKPIATPPESNDDVRLE